MNTPGQASGNWRWRYQPALLTEERLDRLADLTEVYDRTSTGANTAGNGVR